MSNFTNLFSPMATSRQLIYRRVITSSAVVTLPAGKYDIIAVGTGGSGGRAVGINPRATGGGGPAWARDWGGFTTSTDVTIEIGARAAGLTSASTTVGGNSGGTTTVTGIESNITLTGGEGGRASINSTADLMGGAGGVATGGKIRANGGRGGNIVSTTVSAAMGTGGGACDIFCLGDNKTRGGDITSATGTSNTGGGGVGGRGGDVISTTTSTTAGGGAGGDAKNEPAVVGNSGADINGTLGDGTSPSEVSVASILASYPVIFPISSGTSAAATIPGRGGGSASGTDTAAATIPFGGSGAGRNSTAAGQSKSCTYGGGSGAQTTQTADTAQLTGAGGQSFVVISVYSDVY